MSSLETIITEWRERAKLCRQQADDDISEASWTALRASAKALDSCADEIETTIQALSEAVCERCAARELAGEFAKQTTRVSYAQFEQMARAYWDTHPGCADAKGTTKRMLFDAGITVDERSAIDPREKTDFERMSPDEQASARRGFWGHGADML